MRKFLSVYIVPLFLLISCANKESKTIEVDSVPSDLEESQKYYEDEDKVISELQFFISKKDFDKNESKYLESIKDKRLNNYMIGNYKAMTYPKTAFENDSLYYVEFRGQPYQAKDYEGTLMQQYKELVELYKSKYGQPSFQVSSFPKSHETREGYYQELARWDLGKRTISIRLTEWSNMFCVNLTIFRNDIENRIKEKKQQEAEKQKMSAHSAI